MNKTIGALLLGVALLGWGCAENEDAPEAEESAPAASARSEDDKVIYAMGALMGKNTIQSLRLSEAELEVFVEGLSSTARGGEPEVALAELAPGIQEFIQARAEAGAAEEKKKSLGYLEQAAAEDGAQLSNTGLVYHRIQEGSGPSPTQNDTVQVHYHGTFPSGEVFDSSRDRGEPVEFPLNQVIPCWTEGLQMMQVGETARLVCPSDIAYGDAGRPGIPGGATLVFEVELLSIQGQ